MIQKHCHQCGTALIEKELEGEGIVPYCPQCKDYRFPMYNVAVSMVVIDEQSGNILLIKQYGRPHFILVAGYVNRGEALEEAVKREIKEETNLTVSRIIYNRTSFFEPSNTLMCNFTAFVSDASLLSPNREIDSYQWFSPDEARRNIRPNSLAEKFLNAYLDKVEKPTGQSVPVRCDKNGECGSEEFADLCSHLQKKLFDSDGIYHHLWLAIQNDPELSAVARSRQLHIYRKGKKVLVLAGKAAPKIIRDDSLCNLLPNNK